MEIVLCFTFQSKDVPFSKDKFQHLGASYIVYTAYFHRSGKHEEAFAISLSLGLLKEVYDGFFGRGFSFYDLAYDVLGILLANIIND